MLKFVLPMIILLGCSHYSTVHHNDPILTREMNEKRLLLTGQWESTNKSERRLLELRPSGEYVLNKTNVQELGIWGISGGTYFNLNQKSASGFQNYKILKLTPEVFEYTDAATNETHSYRRVKRPLLLK